MSGLWMRRSASRQRETASDWKGLCCILGLGTVVMKIDVGSADLTSAFILFLQGQQVPRGTPPSGLEDE